MFEPPYPPSYALNNTSTVSLKGWLCITSYVDMPLKKETKLNKKIQHVWCQSMSQS